MKQRIYLALLCKYFLCFAAEIIWYNWNDICRFISGEPPIDYVQFQRYDEWLFWCLIFLPSLLQLFLELIIGKCKVKPFAALLVCNIISFDLLPEYLFVIAAILLGGVRGLHPFIYVWMAVKIITMIYIYRVQNNYSIDNVTDKTDSSGENGNILKSIASTS